MGERGAWMHLPTWTVEDLDRCEHGRHSVDACWGCPGGRSSGNLFLIPRPGLEITPIRTSPSGALEARIGTAARGAPIWVTINAVPPVEESDGL